MISRCLAEILRVYVSVSSASKMEIFLFFTIMSPTPVQKHEDDLFPTHMRTLRSLLVYKTRCEATGFIFHPQTENQARVLNNNDPGFR